MDTQRWKAVKFAAAGGGRLVGEARDAVRRNGRLAARGALGRARASLSGDARRATWPRQPLPSRYDVVVIGDGLAALAALDVLARQGRGRRIGLLAPGMVGETWPSRPRAVLRHVRRRSAEVDVVARSRFLYEGYAGERAMGLHLRAHPSVHLARDLEELDGLAALFAGAPAGVAELIDGAHAARLVQHLDGDGVAGALVEADVLFADIADLLWELGGRAAELGASLVEQCRLEGLEHDDDGWTLVTSRGRTTADIVIDATAEGRAMAAAGAAPGGAWRRWESVITQHVQPFLHAQLLVGADTEISQTGRGEVVVSGHATPYPARQAGGSIEAAGSLAADAVSVMPRLASLRGIAQTWRADLVPDDGLAVVGPTHLEGLLRLGGMGTDPFALAPALGEALALTALGLEPPVPLTRFDPARTLAEPGPEPAAAPAVGSPRSTLSVAR